MRKLLGAIALAIALISAPLFAQAQSTNTNVNTSSSLAAQAEALLQQIAALQAQLAAQSGGTTVSGTGSAPATSVSSANCPLIGRVLRLGSTGDDVSRLQRFLAVDPSIYPEAQITGYYGALTEAAVKRWQTRFNIVSSGTADTTGYGVTGPRTAAAISLQCSTYLSGAGGAAGQSPSVGGFIQVTPVSGNAPLTTQVLATVNTVNSCQAATYTLDWGDGTVPQAIQVPAGRCGQMQQNYTHVYVYGGSYMIRLSAGEHSTTATVQVYGATNPGTPTGVPATAATITVTSPVSGTTYDAGAAANIAWTSSGSIPSGSRVTIDVLNSAGSKVGNSLDNTANLSGTYQWSIPTGYTAGTYRIRATVTNGSQTIALGQSANFSIASAPITNDPSKFSFGPLAISPLVDNNPYKIGVMFNLPCSGASYTLNWGDNSSTDTAATGSCSGNPVTRSYTHTYAANGTYVITLRRGDNLSHVDTASVVISN